jgi:tetratricopeptide (TPR) repeat protein
VAHRLGLREEEFESFSRVVRVATERGDPGRRGRALHGLGRLSSRTGRFLAAESYLRAALAAEAEAPEDPELVRSLILLDLAECLLWSGDEERCLGTLAEAEQALDLQDSPAARARHAKERGNLLLELERYDEAREVLREGRALLKGPGYRALQRALLLASARLFRDLADSSKALRALAVALRSARADGDLRHQAIALYLEADLRARERAFPQAARPCVRALRLARATRDLSLEVQALVLLCQLHRAPGFPRHSLSRAVRLARGAVARASELAVGKLQVRGRIALAMCYLDLGKPRWALAIVRKAVRENVGEGVRRRRQAETVLAHGLVLKASGKSTEAREELRKARQLFEESLRGVASPAVRRKILDRDPLCRDIDEALMSIA